MSTVLAFANKHVFTLGFLGLFGLGDFPADFFLFLVASEGAFLFPRGVTFAAFREGNMGSLCAPSCPVPMATDSRLRNPYNKRIIRVMNRWEYMDGQCLESRKAKDD